MGRDTTVTPASEIKLVHALPGRVRLHCGRLKGNPHLMAEIIGNLKAVPVFTQVEGNPVTGSLLIFFEPQKVLTKQHLRQIGVILKVVSPGLTTAQVGRYLKPGPAPARAPAPLAGSIAQFFSTVNTTVGNALGGMDLTIMLPVSLLVLGIRGFIIEKASPPAWYNLLWFALSTYVMFHPARAPGLAEAEALNTTMEGMAELAIGD